MIVSTLMGWGLGSRAAKLIAYAGIPLLILAAVGGGLWFLRHDAYNDGKRDERAAWEAKATELARQAAILQRRADQLRQSAEQLDRARIARNRQEVNDALRNVADQATSDRQRIRACIELRRQGQNPPACQSQPAR